MFRQRRSKKIGMSPGTLLYVGDRVDGKIRITVMDYTEEGVIEKSLTDIADCRPCRDSPSVTWINISGVHDVSLIEGLGRQFDLHALMLEDVLNTEQRPKLDDYDDCLFLVLKMVTPDASRGTVDYEQVSIILGHNYVISLQEVETDVFNPVRERIRKGKGRIRKQGADYLTYALVDMVVDHYFSALEIFGEHIEDLQAEVVAALDPQMPQIIQQLKKEVLFLRKSVWPMREAVNALTRSESPLLQEETALYLRDVHDHSVQVIDTIETYRDMLSSTLDIYLSSVSNRMNEVMKVLTIIATIFIPMTFIAGIYGMNFKYMPELEWTWSYPVLWIVLIVVFILMVVWFSAGSGCKLSWMRFKMCHCPAISGCIFLPGWSIGA